MRELRPYPYLDDIFYCKSKNFSKCLEILGKIFTRLGRAGMQVNLAKSTFIAKELELLGFILSRAGSKPTIKGPKLS